MDKLQRLNASMDLIVSVLNYVQCFSGETFVIKLGGSFISKRNETDLEIAKSIVLLKQNGINPIVVHGGGSKINLVLNQMGIETKFIDGLRVTTEPVMEVVEMVLSGLINKQITSLINEAGGSAIGISGRDCGLIHAKKVKKFKKCPNNNIEEMIDMGFVGEADLVDPDILLFLEDSSFIPVISPVCFLDEGVPCNVNADNIAGAIAVAMSASKLIIMTDTDGVKGEDGSFISTITLKQCEELIEKKVIHSGMIPKIRSCMRFIESGCGAAHIINGTVKDSLLRELFTDTGNGTMIVDGGY